VLLCVSGYVLNHFVVLIYFNSLPVIFFFFLKKNREIKEKNKAKREAKLKAAKAVPKSAPAAKGAAKTQASKQKQPKVKQTKGAKR
jgi:hypothetical protein